MQKAILRANVVVVVVALSASAANTHRGRAYVNIITEGCDSNDGMIDCFARGASHDFLGERSDTENLNQS
jgi:hypothetical protein